MEGKWFIKKQKSTNFNRLKKSSDIWRMEMENNSEWRTSKCNCPTLLKNYSLSKKSVHLTIFWITFLRNKIETCGFRRSTAKVKWHLFTRKHFSEQQFWSQIITESLKSSVGLLNTCMGAYWFFHIFRISIEKWVNWYMLRTFAWHFFFVGNLWHRVLSINKVSKNAGFIVWFYVIFVF